MQLCSFPTYRECPKLNRLHPFRSLFQLRPISLRKFAFPISFLFSRLFSSSFFFSLSLSRPVSNLVFAYRICCFFVSLLFFCQSSFPVFLLFSRLSLPLPLYLKLPTNSGGLSMGKARRRVQHTSLQSLPEPREGEVIMRVVGPRGSNIIEVEDENSRPTLCLLPAKFHKILWLKRGNFVIVEEGDRDAADNAGSKVTGTISTVLYAEHVTALRKTSFWPVGFNKAPEVLAEPSLSDVSSLSLQNRETEKTAVEMESSGLVETRGSRELIEERKNDSSSDEEDDLPPLEENFNRKNVPSFSDSSDSEGERTM